MAAITLKDIPSKVHKALKLRAKRHGRSLNKEVIACLEEVVLPKQLNINELIPDLRRHRQSMPGRLTQALINEAHDVGRP